jgi:hypothetical protein
MRKKYSSTSKVGIITLRASKRVYVGQTLFTRDGRRVTVTNSNPYWLYGKIGIDEFTWFDTGNFIGSNCPHELDIDWTQSYMIKPQCT